MDLTSILFWIAVVIVAWLGLRNVITIFIGSSQTGPLKHGQHLCHATSLLLYWGACGFAIYYRIWWPLAVGIILELLFRKSIIRSGEIIYKCEIEMLFAVRTDNINELINLIEQGADINWKDSKMEGVTALHEAARKGNIEIARYLLQNGADINSKNYNGLTPLHIAAYCGENIIVNTLIAEGAKVNAKAKDNITPLHAAASMGHQDTVELLINNGAEVHTRSSKDALTPQDFATRDGHQGVAGFLSRY
ncbi:MAG: hypothetical protein DRP65_01275 [Planctomycetota bacterium]|nr:MAG: hypothetical protein DRP65_01275 [Planctomycetota bacterium]